MKIEISDEHYFELIKDIFEEIYIEICTTTISQKEFYYCELGDNALSFYPNFNIFQGKVISSGFEKFEYKTQPKDLEKFLLSKLNRKYKAYFGKEIIYESGKPKDLYDYNYNRLEYDFQFSGTVQRDNVSFEEAIFQQTFCFLNIPTNSLNEEINNATEYIKNIKSSNSIAYFNINHIIEKNRDSIKLKTDEDINLNYSSNNNIFINDVILFLNGNEKTISKVINHSNFKSLLKIDSNIEEIPNPFIDLFYNTILTQFILFEKEFPNMAFKNDSNFLKCDLDVMNKERLIALSYKIMSLLQSENEQYCIPPFKYILTNQKISRLIYKAIVLVINQKVSEQNRYTEKFNSLFDLGTQEDINLSETYINRIKRIYKKANQKARFRSKLSARNIVTLFYLLKQHEVINHTMNDTEIRTLIGLLTSYSDNTINEYTKELKKSINESSMKDGYLKNKVANSYKSELMTLIETMIDELKK